MDRLTQLRGEAEGSRDSTFDSSACSEAYVTANESSIYVSLSEDDPSLDITPVEDVSLSSAVSPEKSGNDQLISTISPNTNKGDLLGSFKFEKQIDAANILSGGIDIFDDNDNSYDGNELVIDDNAEIDNKSNPDMKIETSELPFQKNEEIEALDEESSTILASKDTEVLLHIDGKNMNAINIGNGLYLYRRPGEDELAAVQIMTDDSDHPDCKFLKVRENAEGNLEVYEEIEIEVPNQPVKGGKTNVKGSSHVPIKGINKVINDPSGNKVVQRKNPSGAASTASTSKDGNSANIQPRDNFNGKMVKLNETRKSPVIHTTSNKEGIPLTKTMVDQQLHPNRQLDNVKTIEVHTDVSKQRMSVKSKEVPEDTKPANIIGKEKETPVEVEKICKDIKDNETKTTEVSKPKQETESNRVNSKVSEAIKIILDQPQAPTTKIIIDKPPAESTTIVINKPQIQPATKSKIESSTPTSADPLSESSEILETRHFAISDTKVSNKPQLETTKININKPQVELKPKINIEKSTPTSANLHSKPSEISISDTKIENKAQVESTKIIKDKPQDVLIINIEESTTSANLEIKLCEKQQTKHPANQDSKPYEKLETTQQFGISETKIEKKPQVESTKIIKDKPQDVLTINIEECTTSTNLEIKSCEKLETLQFGISETKIENKPQAESTKNIINKQVTTKSNIEKSIPTPANPLSKPSEKPQTKHSGISDIKIVNKPQVETTTIIDKPQGDIMTKINTEGSQPFFTTFGNLHNKLSEKLETKHFGASVTKIGSQSLAEPTTKSKIKESTPTSANPSSKPSENPEIKHFGVSDPKLGKLETTKNILDKPQAELIAKTVFEEAKPANPIQPWDKPGDKHLNVSATKIEDNPVTADDKKKSTIEVKLTGSQTNATEPLMPNPKIVPQLLPTVGESSPTKSLETTKVKNMEKSENKLIDSSESKVLDSKTKATTIYKNPTDNLVSEVSKNPTENVVPEVPERKLENVSTKEITVESGAHVEGKATAKSEGVQADKLKVLKPVTNEKVFAKTPDIKSNELDKIRIEDTLQIKTTKLRSNPERSEVIENVKKNEPTKTPKDSFTTNESSVSNQKITENQSELKFQQSLEPKSTVVQNLIQSQVKPPAAKVKIEQKPKENPYQKTIDKHEEHLQPPSKKSISMVSLTPPMNKSAIPTKNENITLKSVSDQKVKIVENIILVPTARKEVLQHKPLDIFTSKHVKIETQLTVPDKYSQNSTPEGNTTSESKATIISVKPTQMVKNQDKQVEQMAPLTTMNYYSKNAVPEPDNIQNINILKQEIPKLQGVPHKMGTIKTLLPDLQSTIQKKTEVKIESATTIVLDNTPMNNNNNKVPFGKWTDSHRLEFVNKFKETKVPTNTSNTKHIKQANDLNRRDVLQKIDSQRQSSNAFSKTQESVKSGVKNAGTFVHKPTISNQTVAFRETKASVKAETPAQKNKPLFLKKPEKHGTAQTSKVQTNLTVTSSYMLKSEGPSRNEFNNQDLIDKTIEGIINRVVAGKPQDLKQTVSKEPDRPPRESAFTAKVKPKEKHSSITDAIEMKMNELHGIPFVERPPHQLPRVYHREVKTYSKSDNTNTASAKPSKIPSLLPVAAPSQPKPTNIKDNVIDLDSEDEVIEHEPVTGDIIGLHKNIATSKPITIVPTTVSSMPYNDDFSKRDAIITEKDFDKFYRRNSVTYSSDLYPNTKITSSAALDFGVKKVTSHVQMPKPSYASMPKSKLEITSKIVPVGEDVFGKNYPSKLQMAYQTALTTKRQIDPPITIIEDKPVQVVFMDSNAEFTSVQLNVQGQQLSPSKKPVHPLTPEPDSFTTSTCDSLDSDMMDSIDAKVPDEAKTKTKHQRKQLLTPVDTPELELIAPSDLGIEVSPKKKRRTEDNKQDKYSMTVVPKKSYLLGRNIAAETHVPQDLTKDNIKEIAPVSSHTISHSDAASAIDKLVKAAELLETQAASFKLESLPSSNSDSPQTLTPSPTKRGRGRPRKYPLPEGTTDKPKAPSPQKRPRLIDAKQKKRISSSDDYESSSSDDIMVKENWTMGKINKNIVCPICSKLFRSENVVFKHVKHCTGPSPNRSDSDKRSLRRSRYSRDSQSIDSKFDDTDGDSDRPIKKSTPKKRRSRELSPDINEDVIVIEDTPVKEKKENQDEPKQHEPRKPTKTKAQYKASEVLSCEHCGKTFRQLSYLVSHKQLHKKTNPKVPETEGQTADKTVFSCEVCKKEFRKLHHLVQHRIIHNPSSAPSRSSRKSSGEQSIEYKLTKEQETKQNDDQSAAFRCEPCDKSFRKLHHLVEHRETHDGINRQKNISAAQPVPEKPVDEPPPPQCDICKKTFRKLHHLSEHKEQHNVDFSFEKKHEKGAKSALSTRDIIHECSLCYMVFPNEHSLNKHFVNCQKKKRQSAAKQAKQPEEAETVENQDTPQVIESVPSIASPHTFSPNQNIVTEAAESVKEAKPITAIAVGPKKIEEVAEAEQKRLSKEQEANTIEQTHLSETTKRDLEELPPSSASIDKPIEHVPEVPAKVKKTEETPATPVKETTPLKKKTPVKEKEQPTSAKRRKSNLPLIRITAAVESSDDDEVRYMLNPDYKGPKPEPGAAESERKLFEKVRSNKRNSLQFDRPNTKDFVKRRTSFQNPSKVTRKSRSTDIKEPIPTITPPAKLETVLATDSDDSDVKYSFPVKTEKPVETKKCEKAPRDAPKEKRKSLVAKRKIISGIARRKSGGQTAAAAVINKPAPSKEVKKRRGEIEHRCDCGELFSSAALLSRHVTLAHTPPRHRRRRTDSPPAPLSAPLKTSDLKKLNSTKKGDKLEAPKKISEKTDAPKKVTEKKETPKKSEKTDTKKVVDKVDAVTPRKKPGRPPGKTPPTRKSVNPETTAKKIRKSGAHRGVPVPEKMKKVMEKFKN